MDRVVTGLAHIDNAYTIHVCQCCMLMHANGECCADDSHGGDGIEPLSDISPDDGLAMGMGSDEHAEGCLQRTLGWDGIPSDYECECERNNFSTSRCEGCGSYLHGSRYAMTVFPGERAPR